MIQAGDFIVAHDTGAYYFTGYSMYNLRQTPPVYGFEETNGDSVTFTLLKKAQSVDDTIAFFS